MNSNKSAYVVSAALYRRIGTELLSSRGFGRSAVKDSLDTAYYADCSGVHSHGLVKLVSLIDSVLRIDRKARPKRVQGRSGHSATVWDANNQLGTVTARLAVEDVVAALDRGSGVAISSVNNATHFLMPYHAIKAALDNNIIMMVMTTAARSEVTAFGGKRPSIGTNPLTIIVPRKKGPPLIVDCATSAVSFGKLKAMSRAKKPLQPGMAIDKYGRETLDPALAVSTLPAGRLGLGLGLAVEAIAALIGGSTPSLRGKFNQGRKGEKHNCCFFFIGIKPASLSGKSFACGRTQAQNVDQVLDSIKLDGGGKIRYPGERRTAILRLAKKYRGAILPQGAAEELIKLASAAGLKVGLADFKKIKLDPALLQ